MKIPFNDIKSHYRSIKNEIDSSIHSVFESGQFIGGPIVKTFEEKFSSYHTIKHCISTGNGTDSLFSMLNVLGIGEGDEVLTPAWSWISTSETISLAGAKPVFVDADPITFNLSVIDAERKITSKTKAILAVHLYGQCCDMTGLKVLCDKHKLILLEDCAQAHGATFNNQIAGAFGKISSFSFYPTKNLGAFGDAGCLLTHDDDLAIQIRRFVNHGGLIKDEHLIEGINSRMDALQAAILTTKLNHLDQWNTRRKQIASLYLLNLKNLDGLTLPMTFDGADPVYHLFVVRCPKRNDLKQFLKLHGIETMIHYPKAIPFEPAYAKLNYTASDFPVAAQLQDEVLSLPCYPEMTNEMVEYVCDVTSKFKC